jgi:hypothetical protein
MRDALFCEARRIRKQAVAYRDSWRIFLLTMLTIVRLVKGERPLAFFAAIAAAFAIPGMLIGVDLWSTFVETGVVPRFPSAILATGLNLVPS